MRYIIKNIDTKKYLSHGDTFFVWTNDIFKARDFGKKATCQNHLDHIVDRSTRWGGNRPNLKIVGIEINEIEL